MAEKKRKKGRYITGIDGIRSLAVLGVIFYHLMPKAMKGGYLGVPIFFVISGYLITDLMRQEWQENKKIDIKGFYVRRMKRLYPALVVLLISASFYITLFQRNLLNNLRGVVWSSLLYVNNWWQIDHGASYFDRFANASPFTHLWSLAVEGQNYLIWPFVFVLLVRFVKKKSTIFYTLSILTVISAILMAVMYHPGQDPTRVYYGTDTRIFSLWMGSAFAFVWPSFHLKEQIPAQAKKVLNGIGLISFVGLLLFMIFLSDQNNFVYYGGMYIVSILATMLIAVTVHPGASWNRWLTNPVFTYLGKRSYGIYLYQFPVMIFYEAKVKNLANHIWWHTLIEFALILGLSELSYRFVENPLRKYNYRHSFKTIRSWFTKPFISKQKPWQMPVVLVILVALVGIVTAPSNKIDADQQAFQEQIKENQKIAEKTQAETKTSTSDTTDAAQAQIATIMETYDLTKKQAEAAQQKEFTLFGDSVALGTAANINEVFPKAVVDAAVGRQFYESVPILKQLEAQGNLKDTVVIALGTNGSFTSAQFDEVMNYLKGKEVYFINVRVPTQRWQNDVNAMLADKAQSNKKIKILDWYDLSNDHDDWFREDRVHPTLTGRIEYTHLLAEALTK